MEIKVWIEKNRVASQIKKKYIFVSDNELWFCLLGVWIILIFSLDLEREKKKRFYKEDGWSRIRDWNRTRRGAWWKWFTEELRAKRIGFITYASFKLGMRIIWKLSWKDGKVGKLHSLELKFTNLMILPITRTTCIPKLDQAEEKMNLVLKNYGPVCKNNPK